MLSHIQSFVPHSQTQSRVPQLLRATSLAAALGSLHQILNAVSLSSKRQQAKDDNGDCKLILNTNPSSTNTYHTSYLTSIEQGMQVCQETFGGFSMQGLEPMSHCILA